MTDMHSFPHDAQGLARALGGEVSKGDQVLAPGPNHSPADRSLSVKIDPKAPDGFIVHSFAGDDTNDCRDHVRERLGLPSWTGSRGERRKPVRSASLKSSSATKAERRAPARSNGRADEQTKPSKAALPPFKLVATYTYEQADGTPFLRVMRKERPNPDKPDGKDKTFPQQRWDGAKWMFGKPDAPKIPYRLPQLVAAPNAPVFIVEGEKDADRLAAHGFIATCNSEGADDGERSKWTADLDRWFEGRTVYVIPDNDAPGRIHAGTVAKALHGVAAEVRIVPLPDLREKGDASDWFDAGNDPAGLIALCEAAPIYGEPARQTEKPKPVAPSRNGKSAKEGDERPPKQADVLIALAEGLHLFHTPEGTPYVDVDVDGHRETWPIHKSRDFRLWLEKGFYRETDGAPNSEAMKSALGVIESRARFDGPERKVHVRVAEHDGRLYLDLCDKEWRAVEIGPDGWRVVKDPPVRFRRASGMSPLPLPEPGGSIDALRPFLNTRSDADFILAVSWLLATFRIQGPYPILAVCGEQGSAKSTFSKVMRSLIDPNIAALRSCPRDERDLFIAATNGHALAFDNLSNIPEWLSDAFCRIATGGAFVTRQLHTDQDETLLKANRPIILNGIENVVERADLSERSIFLNLEAISEETRLTEREFWAAFHKAHPIIFGALLDAVARGLKEAPHTKLARKPRMADFAEWSVACETALWPAGSFEKAYGSNREEAVETAIEADAVACAVRKLMETQSEWSGTATDLLSALNGLTTETIRLGKSWPKASNKLSGRLKRVAPNLRKIGVEIVPPQKTGRSGDKIIHITASSHNGTNLSSVSSVSSAALEKAQFPADFPLKNADDTRADADDRTPVRTIETDDADDRASSIVRRKAKEINAADDTDDTDDQFPSSSKGERAPPSRKGDVPSLYADAFAALLRYSHPDVPDARRVEVIKDARRLFKDHGETPVRLGWTADDVFGFDRAASAMGPNESMGLVFVLYGSPVIELTKDYAVIDANGERRVIDRVWPRQAQAA